MNEGDFKRYFEFLFRLSLMDSPQLVLHQKNQAIRLAVNQGSTHARLLISRINIQIVRCSHQMGEDGHDHGQAREMGARSGVAENLIFLRRGDDH